MVKKPAAKKAKKTTVKKTDKQPASSSSAVALPLSDSAFENLENNDTWEKFGDDNDKSMESCKRELVLLLLSPC